MCKQLSSRIGVGILVCQAICPTALDARAIPQTQIPDSAQRGIPNQERQQGQFWGYEWYISRGILGCLWF